MQCAVVIMMHAYCALLSTVCEVGSVKRCLTNNPCVTGTCLVNKVVLGKERCTIDVRAPMTSLFARKIELTVFTKLKAKILFFIRLAINLRKLKLSNLPLWCPPFGPPLMSPFDVSLRPPPLHDPRLDTPLVGGTI